MFGVFFLKKKKVERGRGGSASSSLSVSHLRITPCFSSLSLTSTSASCPRHAQRSLLCRTLSSSSAPGLAGAWGRPRRARLSRLLLDAALHVAFALFKDEKGAIGSLPPLLFSGDCSCFAFTRSVHKQVSCCTRRRGGLHGGVPEKRRAILHPPFFSVELKSRFEKTKL